MKKLSLKLILLLLLFSNSFTSLANDSDELEILSRIMEIEKVQKILTEESQIIVTNGLIRDNVQLFIDNVPVNIQNSATNPEGEYLNIEKYQQNNKSAKILMTNDRIKIKVKLVKGEDGWKIKSCYVKNGSSIYASLDW